MEVPPPSQSIRNLSLPKWRENLATAASIGVGALLTIAWVVGSPVTFPLIGVGLYLIYKGMEERETAYSTPTTTSLFPTEDELTPNQSIIEQRQKQGDIKKAVGMVVAFPIGIASAVLDVMYPSNQ